MSGEDRDDAIIAVATAPGRGGIGVVRVSSGRSLGWLAQALLHRPLVPRQATYAPFLDAEGHPIDRGIALYFPAPHSYTGEDVLELQGHGGSVVLHLLMQRCLVLAQQHQQRLRLAEPGEFTRRAFLHDKMDLTQAEAVADLIEAQTEAAAKSASASLSGVFAQEVRRLVEDLIHLRTLVEATLDFPEEEIDFLTQADALGQLTQLEQQLEALLKRAKRGALLRDGLKIVMAGVPNAGKSSLLNALAGEEAAIVTPIAGTTRDKVERTLHLCGVPVVVMDTAGLRDTEDVVESMGIARTWREVLQADVILHIQDLTAPDLVANAQIAQRFPPRIPVLRVFNKTDAVGQHPRVDQGDVYLSAQQQEGLDLLRQALERVLGVDTVHEGIFMARERHLVALRTAQEHLVWARGHAYCGGQLSDAQLDLFAEELRLAQDQLNSITGDFGSEELLGRIFSQFCIGK